MGRRRKSGKQKAKKARGKLGRRIQSDEKGSVTVEKWRVHRGERRELREGGKQSGRERAALMSTAHTM